MLATSPALATADNLSSLKGPAVGRGVVAALREDIEEILAPLMRGQNKKLGGPISQWQGFGNFADRLGIIELAIPIEMLSNKRQAIFFRRLINLAFRKKEFALQLKFLVPYLSRNTPEPVKREIVDKLAGQIETLGKRSMIRRSAEHLLEGFFNGVRDIDELSRLVRDVDLLNRLSSRGVSEGIKSQLCIAQITPVFRQMELPKALSIHAPPRVIWERLSQVHSFLSQASLSLARLKQDLGKSWAYKQYAEWLSHNRRFLKVTLGDISEGRDRRRKRIDLFNLVIAKLRVEMKYSLLLSMPGIPPRIDNDQKPWDVNKVRELSVALKIFPERELFLTRKVFRVCVFEAEKYWGLADGSAIRLEQSIFDSLKRSKGVAGRRHAQGILLHEFGHVLPYYSSTDSEDTSSKLTWNINCVSGRRFLFNEFIKFHGWLEVPREECRLIPDPLSPSTPILEIRGVEYPFDTPVIFNERLVIFTKSGRAEWKTPATKGIRVFVRNAGARSPGPKELSYEPYEEWCEAFRTYVQNPISLLRNAPHLAYYFELLFRLHDSTPVDGLGATLEELKLDRSEFYLDVCRARAPKLLEELRVIAELPRFLR